MEDYRQGHIPDVIVDDGGDMTLIHEGKKADELFLKDGTIPDPISTENAGFNIFPNHHQAPTRKWRDG